MPKSLAAVITPVFPPYRGGMGVLAELDARQLAAAGREVHVYAPSRPAGALGRAGVTAGAPFSVRPLTPLFRYGNAAVVPSLREIVRRYPLVVLHYPFYGGAEFAALAERPHGTKLLLAYHMDTVGRGLLGAVFRAHAATVMPSILRAADRILVTSRDYAASSALAGVAGFERYVRELAPAVDAVRFAPGPRPADLADRLGIGHGDKVALMVGGLDRAHYFKGVPLFLRALATRSLDGVKGIIVGNGDLRPSYEKSAADLGLADRVRFAGSVEPAELARYYRLADVFVFPSVDRSEAFGLAALEALASGVPAVASSLPGVRTIVRDGVTGRLAVPGSVSSLTARLSDMLADDAERRRMGERARVMVEREYAEPARLARWQELLAELGV
ncbi:glycosyltransferase family 4 protein [Candidatus Uhrbacteria bacterium]|nr:glycosyltransferase family 4 protein [Candidatus Uhrbacteria bacterium]